MPDEQDLRDLLAGAEPPRGLDTSTIVRRSRARRLPRQIVAGTAGALAVVGVGVFAVQVIQPPVQSTMMYEQSDGAAVPESAQDSALRRAPADKLNLCEGMVAEPAPSAYGLELDVAFPATAPADGQTVDGTVLLTNTGARHVAGITAEAPAITVSQDGTVLWHSTADLSIEMVAVDLEPGESLEYAASFDAVRCSAADDALERFPEGLPPLGPGAYEVSAAIDFSPDASMTTLTTELDLVTGQREPITLQ